MVSSPFLHLAPSTGGSADLQDLASENSDSLLTDSGLSGQCQEQIEANPSEFLEAEINNQVLLNPLLAIPKVFSKPVQNFADAAAKLPQYLKEADEFAQSPLGKMVLSKDFQNRMELERALVDLQTSEAIFQAFYGGEKSFSFEDKDSLEALQVDLIAKGEAYRNHLASEVERLKEKMRGISKKNNSNAGGYLGVGSTVVDQEWLAANNRVSQAQEKLKVFEVKLNLLKHFSFSSEKAFDLFFTAFLSLSAEIFQGQRDHVRSLMAREVESVRDIPSSRFNWRLDSLENKIAALDYSIDGEVSLSEKYRALVEEIKIESENLAAIRSIDAEVKTLKVLEGSTKLADKIVNGLSYFIKPAQLSLVGVMGSGFVDDTWRWSGEDIHTDRNLRQLRELYEKADALFMSGDIEGAKKMLIELQRYGFGESNEELAKISGWVNFGAGVGIVTASAFTAGLAGEATATIGAEWGLGGAVLEGAAFAVNSGVFYGMHRALEHSWQDKPFLDPKKSGLENAAELLEGYGLTMGMLRFLGRINMAVMGHGGPRVLLWQLKKGGGRAVSALGNVGLWTGAFAAEFAGFGAWDYLAANYDMIKLGIFDPIGTADKALFTEEAWKERFKFLVGLKLGGAAAKPVKGPVGDFVKDYSLRFAQGVKGSMGGGGGGGAGGGGATVPLWIQRIFPTLRWQEATVGGAPIPEELDIPSFSSSGPEDPVLACMSDEGGGVDGAGGGTSVGGRSSFDKLPDHVARVLEPFLQDPESKISQIRKRGPAKEFVKLLVESLIKIVDELKSQHWTEEQIIELLSYVEKADGKIAGFVEFLEGLPVLISTLNSVGFTIEEQLELLDQLSTFNKKTSFYFATKKLEGVLSKLNSQAYTKDQIKRLVFAILEHGEGASRVFYSLDKYLTSIFEFPWNKQQIYELLYVMALKDKGAPIEESPFSRLASGRTYIKKHLIKQAGKEEAWKILMALIEGIEPTDNFDGFKSINYVPDLYIYLKKFTRWDAEQVRVFISVFAREAKDAFPDTELKDGYISFKKAKLEDWKSNLITANLNNLIKLGWRSEEIAFLLGRIAKNTNRFSEEVSFEIDPGLLKKLEDLGFFRIEILDVLVGISDVAKIGTGEAFAHLGAVFDALMACGIDYLEVPEILIWFIRKGMPDKLRSGGYTFLANYVDFSLGILIDFYPAAIRVGWSQDQIFDFLKGFFEEREGDISQPKKYRSEVIFSKSLFALSEGGWTIDQQIKLLNLISKGSGYRFGELAEELGEIIACFNRWGTSIEEQIEFFEKILTFRLEGIGVSPKGLGGTAKFMRSLEALGWEPFKIVRLVTKIAEKLDGDSSTAFGLLNSFHVMSPNHFDSIVKSFVRLIGRLSLHNRRVVFDLLNSNLTLLKEKVGSENLSGHIALYAEIFKRWPRLGFNLLEGIFEAIEKGIISPNLDDHRKVILSFIEKMHSFNPALYQGYFAQDAQGRIGFIEKLEAYAKQFRNDEMSLAEMRRIAEQEGEEFLLCLIQMVSPTSGSSFVPKEKQLQLMRKALDAGDLRGDIPAVWHRMVKTFELEMGGWKLKEGKVADAKREVANLLQALSAEPLEDLETPTKEQLQKAIQDYVVAKEREARDTARKKVLNTLYAYARAEKPELLAKIMTIVRTQGDPVRQLEMLAELFKDKDNLPKALEEAIDSAVKESELEWTGTEKIDTRPSKLDNLKSKLKRKWRERVDGKTIPRDNRLVGLYFIVRNYSVQEIQAHLLGDPDLSTELKQALIEVIEEAPKIRKMRLVQEILGKPQQIIQQEKANYDFVGEGSIKLGLRAVKGPSFGLHGMTSGVCKAQDMKLWKSQNFKLLAIIDKTEGSGKNIVGYIQLYEVEGPNGEKALALPGINPSTEFMGTISAAKLYPELMKQVIEFARVGGYEKVYIPTSKDIHSNREDIKKEIANAGYHEEDIPVVNWDSREGGYGPYPFSEVYVVWEAP